MTSVDPTDAGNGTDDASPTGTSASTNPKMRKRTKTGCLTCRKRRIKCGEERPTCANCIKSKRQCEGYNQRVVFKPPIGDWPNHPGAVSTLQYHNSTLPGTRTTGFRPVQDTAQSQEDALTSIQPRPLTQFEYSTETTPTLAHLNTQQAYLNGAQPHDSSFQQPLASPHHQTPLYSPHHQHPLHSPHHQIPTPTSATSYFPQPSPINTSLLPSQFGQGTNSNFHEHQRFSQNGYQNMATSFGQHSDSRPSVSQTGQEPLYYHETGQATSRPDEQISYARNLSPQSNVSPHSNISSHSSTSPQTDGNYAFFPDQSASLQRYGGDPRMALQQPHSSSINYSQAGAYVMPSAGSRSSSVSSNFQHVQIPRHEVHTDAKYMSRHTVYEKTNPPNRPQTQLRGFGGVHHISPTQELDEAAVEAVDDDYWDVEADEEMASQAEGQDEDAVALGRDFSLIRRIHFENTSELAMRRYDTFIHDGILSHYKTEEVANPLKNPKTARVFAHFINVTGPSLSIYERNPRNPTSIFEGPSPPSQQSLWTYILPLKALGHQGLLHAMLAIASLHIAKLQGASVTPSYKHYAYALKRLGRSLANPKKRHSTATLATSLLLAFYEEHVKWSTHLVGAAQLVAELDFPSLTREARRIKATQLKEEARFPYHNPDMLIDQKLFNQKLAQNVTTPDEILVSMIVGQKVTYDDFGKITEDAEAEQGKRGFKGKLDLQTYETLQDLYWYYSRQDAYQSIVSGNCIVTDFRKWTNCPPRAPLGRGDALYGTHDHIILLLARIADFTYRDRERKLKQVASDGGVWKPRPNMSGLSKGQFGQPPTPTTPMGPPSHMKSAHDGQPAPRGSASASTTPDPFNMAPPPPPFSLSHRYTNPSTYATPPTPQTPSITKFGDLPTAYDAALADWTSISHTHATVARILANSEAFAPLTADLYPIAPGGNMTPFGPALVHRSYDISTLWTMLHLSNILLHRSHPAMPPSAHAAAGVCAQVTQPYAMLIGRISAGMQVPPSDDMPLSPFLGAALIESTMALFFAGIQMQTAAQRDWLIMRLLDIDRRTGWASAGAVARSCETSWEKAAELGRGPPYESRKTRPLGEEGPIVLDGNEAEGAGAAGGGWDGTGVWRGQDGNREARAVWERAEKRYVVGEEGKVGWLSGKVSVVPWAKNLIATEEDLRAEMERVELGE